MPLVVGAVLLERGRGMHIGAGGWLVALYIVAVGLCLGYLAWFRALRLLPATTAATATLMVPVVGVLSAGLLLGEPLGWRQLLALGMTWRGRAGVEGMIREGVMTDRPLIRLNPGQERRLKAGHPWAFSNEIHMLPEFRQMPPGMPVRLEGDDGWRLGTLRLQPAQPDRGASAGPRSGGRHRRGLDRPAHRRRRPRCASASPTARSTGWCTPRRTGCPGWWWTATATWRCCRPTPPGPTA